MRHCDSFFSMLVAHEEAAAIQIEYLQKKRARVEMTMKEKLETIVTLREIPLEYFE